MWIEGGRHAFGIANIGADCRVWIDAQWRGCDTSSDGSMGSEEGKTNRQIHIEIDSAMRPTACKSTQGS